jgi:hypothetical protein
MNGRKKISRGKHKKGKYFESIHASIMVSQLEWR